MEQTLDFSKVCRTCLIETTNTVSIYVPKILKMIESCTAIKVTVNDGYPTRVCSFCVKAITVSYNFKQQSAKCDSILRGMIERKDFSNKHANSIKSKTESNDRANKMILEREYDGTDLDHVQNSSLDDQNDESLTFATDVDAKKSVRTDRKNNGFECKVCDKKLVNKYSLSRHMDTHTLERKHSVSCPLCHKKFFEKGNLTKHLLRHKGEKKYKCAHCEKGFYEISAMAFHSKKQHAVKPVECEICRKQFTLQIQLDMHLKLHKENRFICETCGKAYRSNKSLKSHEMLHAKSDPHLCVHCNKWFKYAASLKLHTRRFHQGPRRKEICTVCGKAVTNVKHHALFIHATDRPFKCSECGIAYAKESFLKVHLKTHTGETRNYKLLCPVCGKILQNSTALRIHMRIHTGERPFSCSVCYKSYKTSSALTVHRRTHTGDRPYECSVCRKKFFTKKCVTVHQVVHTGERPYQCKICSQAFGQKSTLKTHMKIH